MTVKDWIDLAITVISFALTVIAGVYTKEKSKLNKSTAAGKAMDTLGQLATMAVYEAEHSGMSNEAKRSYASEVINQGLNWLGVKDVTPNLINGAIENAVNAMHLANSAMDNDKAKPQNEQFVNTDTSQEVPSDSQNDSQKDDGSLTKSVQSSKNDKIEAKSVAENEQIGEIAQNISVDDVITPESIKVGGQDD